MESRAAALAHVSCCQVLRSSASAGASPGEGIGPGDNASGPAPAACSNGAQSISDSAWRSELVAKRYPTTTFGSKRSHKRLAATGEEWNSQRRSAIFLLISYQIHPFPCDQIYLHPYSAPTHIPCGLPLSALHW